VATVVGEVATVVVECRGGEESDLPCPSVHLQKIAQQYVARLSTTEMAFASRQDSWKNGGVAVLVVACGKLSLLALPPDHRGTVT
jgi:hypothetical protein